MKPNLVLLQSYSSPKPLSADIGVLEVLKKHFPDMKTVYEQTPQVVVFGIRKILKLAVKSNLVSSKGDIIFGWGGDLCLYAWTVGKLLRMKRFYFNQNLIIRPQSQQSGLKGKIRFWLYKKALHSKNYITTVNAPELVGYYADMFSCDKQKFVVTYDNRAIDLDEQNQKDSKADIPYVFAGGVAGRDVETFAKVVESLPDIHFKCVFPSSMIIERMRQLPNLEIFSDIPEHEFYKIMNNATICCVPLNSKSPCGLYTLQHAVLVDIPIVSTDTWSMRTVVPDDSCGYLLRMYDYQAMADKVRMLMDDKTLRQTVCMNARNNFSKFEPHNVGEQLSEVINNIAKYNTIC